MGFDSRSFQCTVHAAVSRHNSARDERDAALWELLKAEIKLVVEDPKFAPIRASFDPAEAR